MIRRYAPLATIGAVTVLALLYFAAAFVTVDLNWMNGVWGWSRIDRALLIFLSCCFAAIGALIALLFKVGADT